MRSTSHQNIYLRFPWVLFLCFWLWTSIGLFFPQPAFADAPVLAGIEGGALGYTENDLPTAITATLTVSDTDDTNLQGATVRITDNYQSSEDVLAFTNTANITGSWTAATGILTLSNSDTVENYQTALRTVTYENSSDSPTTATRTLTFTVNDATASSISVTRDVSVTADNDAPTITNIADLETVEDTATGAIAFTVGDVETAVADLAVTATSSNQALVPDGSNIALGGANADRTVTLTPAANEFGTATITVTVSDAEAGTVQQSFTVTVDAVNDDPTDIKLSNTIVEENMPSGTVVDTFTTTDVDISDFHTYMLTDGPGDTNNSSFQIVGDTLITQEAFDFETQSSYSIRVRTEDQSGGTYDEEFTISVNDNEEITLVWDANSEPDLVGYRVYQSDESGVYDFKHENAIMVAIVEAEVEENDYAIVDSTPEAGDSLIPAGIETLVLNIYDPGPWYWVVVAFDSEGFASNPSYEISNVNQPPTNKELMFCEAKT